MTQQNAHAAGTLSCAACAVYCLFMVSVSHHALKNLTLTGYDGRAVFGSFIRHVDDVFSFGVLLSADATGDCAVLWARAPWCAGVPDVDLKVETHEIKARTRKLNLRWTSA